MSANANQDSRGSGPISISLPGMTLMVSKPGGGKTHLANYLIYTNRHRIGHAIAFSKSAFRPGNIAFMPNFSGSGEDAAKYHNFKHTRYNKDVMREFLEGQARYPEGQRPLGLVYIDDDVSEAGMFNDEYIIDAATMYRQYNLWVIIATQYVNKVSTTVRECASEVSRVFSEKLRNLRAQRFLICAALGAPTWGARFSSNDLSYPMQTRKLLSSCTYTGCFPHSSPKRSLCSRWTRRGP